MRHQTNGVLGLVSVILSAAVASALAQPMVGVVLLALVITTMALSHSLGRLPWLVFVTKLGLVVLTSILAPALWPNAGGLIPVNPDQQFYIDTADRIAEALRIRPFAVDYAGIVGIHNCFYNIVLGWLAFLNGRGSLLLYRLFNLLVSVLLASASAALAQYLYPRASQVTRIVFASVAFLPSVNAYAMFVLRDVLIATLLMTVTLGLFCWRPWILITGLIVAFFTRLQLFFLLGGAAALLFGIKISRHARGYAPILRLALTVTFVIAGYFIAPFVLPPEYDYSRVSTLAGFGRFLLRLPFSLLGLDFLFAGREALELDRGTLIVTRLILFDTWLAPLLFLGTLIWYRKTGFRWREFWLWVWAISIGYVAGYWMAYGMVFVRLLMPLYPLFLIASYWIIARPRDIKPEKGSLQGA